MSIQTCKSELWCLSNSNVYCVLDRVLVFIGGCAFIGTCVCIGACAFIGDCAIIGGCAYSIVSPSRYMGSYVSSPTGKLVFQEGVLVEAIRKGCVLLLLLSLLRLMMLLVVAVAVAAVVAVVVETAGIAMLIRRVPGRSPTPLSCFFLALGTGSFWTS